MVKECGETVAHFNGRKARCNSGTVIVQQWDSNGGTVWWNSETVMVERWNSVKEQWNSHGGTA